jgi:hypothetical protein
MNATSTASIEETVSGNATTVSGNATATSLVARNNLASAADGSPQDVAYLIVMALFAFTALQAGLALREIGAARPHATHELMKKYVRDWCVVERERERERERV